MRENTHPSTHLLEVLFSLPTTAVPGQTSVIVHCKRSSAVSISVKLQKKEVKKKKGQVLHPAVGEAEFSTDDDDSQRLSWRLELGMRLG